MPSVPEKQRPTQPLHTAYINPPPSSAQTTSATIRYFPGIEQSPPTMSLLPPPLLPFLPLVPFLLLLTIVCYFIHRRRGLPENDKRRLPPGSLGWPYIGETLSLYTQNPNNFFSKRQKRLVYCSLIFACFFVITMLNNFIRNFNQYFIKKISTHYKICDIIFFSSMLFGFLKWLNL